MAIPMLGLLLRLITVQVAVKHALVLRFATLFDSMIVRSHFAQVWGFMASRNGS